MKNQIQKSNNKLLVNKLVILTCLLASSILVIVMYKLKVSQYVAEHQIFGVDTEATDNFVAKDQALDISLWKSSSTIKSINYFSFDCPFCRDSFLFDMDENLNKDIKNQVDIVYRHRPLDSQSLSLEKAVIFECVRSQEGEDKSLVFIKKVSSDYKYSNDNNWFVDTAKAFITNKNFDVKECYKDKNNIAKVEAIKNKAIASNIKTTPTVVIFKNGTEYGRYNGLGPNIISEVYKALAR